MEALRRLLLVLAMGWMVLGSFVLLMVIREGNIISLLGLFIAMTAFLPPVGVWWIAQGLKK